MEYIDEEITPDEISLDSFEVKDRLNDRFWDDDMRIDQHIRRALLVIAKDFIDEYDLGSYEIDDVTVTGSIANYNWSEDYSDVDLHIVMDITKLNDDKTIAKTFCDAIRSIWNKVHTDISVGGFPVEVYIQDSHEPHKSSGVYSILDDKWLTEPSIEKLEKHYEEDEVQEKVAYYMNLIDDLEERLSVEDPAELYKEGCNLMDEIKLQRANSMKGDNVELTTGNLVFKSLRRNNYIEKLIDIKRSCFDAAHSLK